MMNFLLHAHTVSLSLLPTLKTASASKCQKAHSRLLGVCVCVRKVVSVGEVDCSTTVILIGSLMAAKRGLAAWRLSYKQGLSC